MVEIGELSEIEKIGQCFMYLYILLMALPIYRVSKKKVTPIKGRYVTTFPETHFFPSSAS